ncbi:MAG: hypothetical protein COB51_14330, partial [Moraxellaceae bacterium]
SAETEMAATKPEATGSIEAISKPSYLNSGARSLQAFKLQAQVLSHPPRFLSDNDIVALEALLEKNYAEQGGVGRGNVKPGNVENGALIGVFSGACLQKLERTGRLYYCCKEREPTQSSIIQWQSPRSARMVWKVDSEGCQRLDLSMGNQCDEIQWFCLSSEQLFFFDGSKNQLGFIDNVIAKEVVDYIKHQRAVDPNNIESFVHQYQNFLHNNHLPEPVSLSIVQVHSEVILPQLRLFSGAHPETINGVAVNEGACLGFQYCFDDGPPPEFFPCRAQVEQKALFFNGSVYQVHRNLDYEAKVLERIRQQASCLEFISDVFSDGVQPVFDFVASDRDSWRQLFAEQLPDIKASGCEVVVENGFPFHFVCIDEWYGDVKLVDAADKIDWFDFELGVRIDGESVNLLPSLLALVRRYPARFSLSALGSKDPNERIAIPLADGRLVDLSVGRLRNVLSVLVELLHSPSLQNGERLVLPAVQAARLAQLQNQFDEGIDIQDESGLFARAVQVEEISQVEWVALPSTVNAELRDYQHFGVSWMVALKKYGMGGILADDMGLGKTLQTLAFLSVEKQQGCLTAPALVVMPTSLLFNWQREIKQFTPDLSCLVYHGAQRELLHEQMAEHDVILTTYGLMVKDLEFWQQQELSHLILDEAQNIKNSRAKISQAVKRIHAPFRLCLSGTPMENNLAELWSLFDFILPGFLDSIQRFKKYYQDPIEKEGDSDQARALFSRVAPFILRRCKSEVATELPPKTETVIRIPLQEQQQDLYEGVCFSIKQNLLSDLQGRGNGEGRILILNALLTLRQICCDPRLARLEQYDQPGISQQNNSQQSNSQQKLSEEKQSEQKQPEHKNSEIGSAKLEHTLSMVDELVAEGRKILLFSQFTSMLSLLGDRLDALGIPYVMLTGKSRNRQQLVEQFQQGEVPVFLISLKAGGVGLNLTAADTVIHYDPWWNPAVQQQATDRAYRIGQDKPVFVYKLIMEDTVEEKIYQLQERKQLLLKGLNDAVQHRSEQLQLTQQELLAILA